MNRVPYQRHKTRLTAVAWVCLRPSALESHPDEWWGEAKLDTGAQLTHIPDMLALRLGLAPSGTIPVVGMAGGVIYATHYTVSLEVRESATFHPTFDVIGTATDRIVLGLDFLAFYTTCFFGETSEFSLEPHSPSVIRLPRALS